MRPDAIRRHNLAVLLGHVHRDGALTRAELTARLGVSRSTVAALVSDLSRLGLVEEVVPSGGAGVGRPSYVVAPDPTGPIVVAVDIDLADLTAAAVGIGGSVLERRVVPTVPVPASPSCVADLIEQTVVALQHDADRPVLGVGISVPGTVDKATRTVGVAPNLGWREARLGDLVSERLGPAVSVSVGNDADLALLSEHSRGSARGCTDVVYLIGRIGVGAGLLVNGSPVRGVDGRAGEIGHNVVTDSGPPCHCGKHGCLETVIGDQALLRLAHRDLEPSQRNLDALFADARRGDDLALSAVHTAADTLGRALGSLVNTVNPQRVVLGGSLCELLAVARPQIEEGLARYAFDPAHAVELVGPRFGPDSALLGAAELAFLDLLEDPLVSERLSGPLSEAGGGRFG